MNGQKLLIAVALPQELGLAAVPDGIPVAYTGVGKLNAALSLWAAIETHNPRHVINYGTVGALSEHTTGLLEVADTIQRDMDATPLFARGITPFDETPHRLSSGRTGVVCATGDNFLQSTDPWLREQGVDIVDMELFALALVCHRKGLTWQSFKYVTDQANDQSGEDWPARVHWGQALFLERLDHLLESAGP